MENEQKRNNENKSAEKHRDTSCCGGWGMSEMMAKCWGGMNSSGDSKSMMAECMRKCRWFLLIPMIMGILFFCLFMFCVLK